MLVLLSVAWAGPARAMSPRHQLSDLPIGMMVHPPSLDYFNQMARPDDIGAVLIVNTQLLPEITAGQRLVMSPSVELAEEKAPEFVDDADYFGYNIEHWSDTPDSEQQDPVTAAEAAAEFARAHSLIYMIGPDLDFTEGFGAGLAHSADVYVIQGQRLQEDLPRFTSTVTGFAKKVRSGNPSVKVWVQVSGSFGTPADTLLALRAVQDHIDGIWIHYNQNAQSFAALQELVERLRPAPPTPQVTPNAVTLPTASPVVSASEQGVASPIALLAPTQTTSRPTPTATPAATASVASAAIDPPAETTPTTWLPVVGGAMMLVAGALVVLGLVLAYLRDTFR